LLSDKLWTAPEILVQRVKEGDTFVPGTQEGDVYSFAIIVQEILYRQGPFFVCEDNQPQPKGYIFLSSVAKVLHNVVLEFVRFYIDGLCTLYIACILL